jgi:hypothetical protein
MFQAVGKDYSRGDIHILFDNADEDITQNRHANILHCWNPCQQQTPLLVLRLVVIYVKEVR